MPLYAYKCKDCGEEAEYIQKFSDPPMTECEHCGGRIDKQITAAAFHLKGGGWYKDGYARAKAEAGAAEGKSSEAAGGEAPAADKSEPPKGDAGGKAAKKEPKAKRKPDSKKSA